MLVFGSVVAHIFHPLLAPRLAFALAFVAETGGACRPVTFSVAPSSAPDPAQRLGRSALPAPSRPESVQNGSCEESSGANTPGRLNDLGSEGTIRYNLIMVMWIL